MMCLHPRHARVWWMRVEWLYQICQRFCSASTWHYSQFGPSAFLTRHLVPCHIFHTPPPPPRGTPRAFPRLRPILKSYKLIIHYIYFLLLCILRKRSENLFCYCEVFVRLEVFYWICFSKCLNVDFSSCLRLRSYLHCHVLYFSDLLTLTYCLSDIATWKYRACLSTKLVLNELSK